MKTVSTLPSGSVSPAEIIFLLLVAAVWVLVRPYDGLVHDAQLYAVQALATLYPEIFSGDLFLRYGSQNDFTLFPRIYGTLVQAIGVERSAALLTLTCSLLWLAMGWRIARRLMNKHMALLALGLLVAVKPWYGGFEVFRAGEMFLSARLPAEVLALAAVSAFLAGSLVLAGLLVLLSGLLHPLMALPIVMLFVFMLADERWGVRSLKWLFPALIFAGTAATLVLPGNSDQNSDVWLSVLRTRSIFLFPAEWRFQDWQHHGLVIATLGLAVASTKAQIVARLAACSILLGLVGVGLAAVAGALPEHYALLKIQPWRWLWPAAVVSIILLPGTVRDLWCESALPAHRICAIMLLAAWLSMDSFGGVIAVAALVIFWIQVRVSDSALRTLRVGAWLILAATLASVSVGAVQCAMYPLDTNFDAVWVQRLVNALPNNSTTVAAIVLCWPLAQLAARSQPRTVVSIILASALLLGLVPRAYRTWTTERFTPATHDVFASWRAAIPETAEVLWPINPTGVWILLERRSYMSDGQLAGLLYSPRMTAELMRRAEALEPMVAPGWWTLDSQSEQSKPKELTPHILRQICRAPGPEYVVDGAAIDGYIDSALFPVERVRVYLYECRLVDAWDSQT